MPKATRGTTKAQGKKPLADYAAKRDFSKTQEPAPRAGQGAKHRAKTLSFVIQKHAARRLHYDLRLELDGVLKSWAVTRGPSLAAGEKRLAVQVEDHPLDYGDFEGTIPKGEYGGGEVIVWDRGTWTSMGDPHRGLEKGHLEFALVGEKLHGRWHLVRMRSRRGESKPQWLFIKAEDDYARSGKDAEITDNAPLSVKTGRPIDALKTEDHQPTAASQPRSTSKRAKAHKKRPDPLPDFIEPCLATLVAMTPNDPAMIHEIKFDGYRIQVRCEAGEIKYLSRSGLDYTDKIVPSTLHDEIVSLGWNNVIVDGELIVEGPGGLSDFAALQHALKANARDRLRFMAFDCLFHEGQDVRMRSLSERKTILRDILPESTVFVRYSEDIAQGGTTLLNHACRMGLEGIVSKRRDAPYRSGRGHDWLKSKCVAREEFVIAGFTPSTAMKRAIGALVLGVYEGDRLMPVGRAGSGFSVDTAQALFAAFNTHKRATPPFAVKPETSLARGAVWIEPVFVADIEFRGVTPEGALRHPVFKGLRDDKDPFTVTRQPDKKNERQKNKVKKEISPLTHPERIFWPDVGVTKQGLLDYYEAIFDWMAPHIVGRPLALIRCPDGVGPHCFFQKHAWAGLSQAVQRVRDPSNEEELLVVNDFDGLAAFAQAGVLEIHPWGAKIETIEQPDRVIFDLDPGEGVPWSALIDAAQEIRMRLQNLGCESFVKTSGGKGLHVVIPFEPLHDWATVKDWTHSIATQMAAERPQAYVATIKKSARAGKILIDYLRNGRGATAVAVFSPRARPGAPVSTPLAWDELDAIAPTQFHIGNIFARLDHLKDDPWKNFFTVEQKLPIEKAKRESKKGTQQR